MNFKKLRAIIIEDEDLVRSTLKDLLNSSQEMVVVADIDSVERAYCAISQENPDVLFLDIKLRGGDASMLIRKLKVNNIVIPPIILMTAFSDRLFGFFEYSKYIIDALPKPFFDDWDNKFLTCLEKVNKELLQRHQRTKGFYLLETKNLIRQIPIDDIVFFRPEGSENSKPTGRTEIFIEGSKKEIVDKSLRSILANQLSNYPKFRQIHRNHIINTTKILCMECMPKPNNYRRIQIMCNSETYFLRIGEAFENIVDDYKNGLLTNFVEIRNF